MRRSINLFSCASILAVLSVLPLCAADWPTYGHDPSRSGWAKEEKTLNTQNVPHLQLQWKTQVKNSSFKLSALTPPIVVNRKTADGVSHSVVYVAGISGTVFALDGATGDVIWNRTLRSMALPGKGGFQGTFLCPNGITATPVGDPVTGNLYAIAPDGALYGLDLDTGKVQFGPTPFVAPFAKTWSLNLIQEKIYTTVSLGCGNGRAGVYAADIGNPQQPAFHQLLLSKAYTAGIWGRGGIVAGDNGLLYGGTADGDTNPQKGDYSNSVVSIKADDLSLHDFFLPPNYEHLKKSDLDVGSASPSWFRWKNRNLLAHGFKEGVIYLLDADHLGGANHQTPLYVSPRLGNDHDDCCTAAGIWGSLSSSVDEDGNTWLYVPMGGPPSAQAPKFPITNGDNPHGSIMAFKISSQAGNANPSLAPAWISSDFYYPDPAVIANGVVFALSNGENPDQHGDESRRLLNTRPAVLKALDAKTGRELYNSGSAITTWSHFSALAIADGHIYVVDHDSNVYCFGVGGKQAASPTLAANAVQQDQMSTSWVGRAQRSDEYLSSWLKRIVGTAAFVLAFALAGVWIASREDVKSASCKR